MTIHTGSLRRTFILTLVLGFGPAGPVAAAAGPDGTLIVLNKAENSASLIDLPSGRMMATLPTGVGPHEVVVSPDGASAVVSNYGTREAPGATLTIIDVPGARVVRTLELGKYRRPHGLAWVGGDGRRVAVTAEEQKALLVVDVAAGRVVSTVETGQETSHMVAVAADGIRAFVANIGSGSVSVLDLKKEIRRAVVPTGAGTEGIALTPGGKELWVTNREADTLSILDARTLDVLTTRESKSFPIRIAPTPDGRRMLVSNARSGEVGVWDAASRNEIRRIPMNVAAASGEGRLFGDRFGDSPVPIGILVHPRGKVAFVANSGADAVVILDLIRWEAGGRLTAGREPDGLGFSSRSVRSAPPPAPGGGK